MRRLNPVIMAVFVASGCSQQGMSSRIHVDARVSEGAHMASYKTWNFARPDNVASGIALLDDSVFRLKAQNAIEKDMAARGFVRVFDNTSDLKLMMHVMTEQSVDEIVAANPEFKFASLPTGSVYEMGSLSIFLFDAKTSQMVWQGNAAGELDERADDKTRQKRFMDVVASLIEQIPMGGSPVPAPAK